MMDTVFSFFPSNPNVDVQGLTQGADGNFYGLSSGLNAVFEITPAGSFSILATFDWVGGSMQPIGSLVRGLDGAFYGTTVISGTNEDGSVFKITSARKIVTLYSFNSVRDGSGNNLDGLFRGPDWPWGGMGTCTERKHGGQQRMRDGLQNHSRRRSDKLVFLRRPGRYKWIGVGWLLASDPAAGRIGRQLLWHNGIWRHRMRFRL